MLCDELISLKSFLPGQNVITPVFVLNFIDDRKLQGLYPKCMDLTPWLMEPGGSMPHSQELSNNPYPVPINPIPRIDTYLFKVNSNIVLPSTPRPL